MGDWCSTADTKNLRNNGRGEESIQLGVTSKKIVFFCMGGVFSLDPDF